MAGRKPYEISSELRAQVMAGLALAWDGQWFLKVNDKYGWNAAAEINIRTRHAFGRIEMRNTLLALGKKKADDLQDALEVWQAYFRMFGADRGVFAGDYAIEGDTLIVTVNKCAAWEGAKRARLKKDVQACLTCENLWQVWFSALMPDHEVSQETIARMGFGAPQCRFRVTAAISETQKKGQR
ncbi:MAG TPA: hypothetical protein VMB77_02645 [Syntrophales bacterium]|nr:hypothetical protein [Syntrophales bacterium]